MNKVMAMNLDSALVETAWLAQNLDNPLIKIVDCRFQLTQPNLGYQQYQQGHIPGAFYLDLDKDLSAPVGRHGGRHPLPNLERITEKFTSIGITNGETWVIAYDDSRFAFASRLWWLLRYLGHDKVALLQGGWSGWLRDRYPISQVIPSAVPGRFVANPQTDWIVDIETVRVKQHDPSTVLVDSRECDRYLGEREPIDPIAGHIPGAVCLPWLDVTDEQGYCLPQALQQQRWADYQNTEDLIVYCGSGVTACVNLFSRAIAGLPAAKLYPGGWSDWCSYEVQR